MSVDRVTGPAVFADATTDDVPALVALVNAAYRAPGPQSGWTDERDLLAGDRTDAAMVRDDLASGRILTLRLTPASPILACVKLSRAAEGVWFVAALAVAPARQAHGLGAMLLREAERQARCAGVGRLRMTVIHLRTTLIAWYARRGYRQTGRTVAFPYDDPRVGRPLRDDLALLVLEKDL